MEAIQNRSFVGLIVKAMAVCYLIHLAGCGNYKMCLSNTSIDEVNEQQKLSKK
jgi:hypothetical protein